MSDLIAENSGPSSTAGLRLGDSATALGTQTWGDFQEGEFDVIATSINTALVGLDMLAFVANPLKEFVMAGIGFAIEHISFLREPIEWVTGDPNAVTALAQTWSNIAGELQAAAQEIGDSAAAFTDWEGVAADAYRSCAAGFAESLNGAAGWAQETSRGIVIAGMVVGTVKALLLEWLSEWVAKGVIWLLGALASSVVTFGSSVALALSKLIIDAITLFGRMLKKLGDLCKTAAEFARTFTKLGNFAQGAGAKFDTWAEGLRKSYGNTLVTAGNTTGRLGDWLDNGLPQRLDGISDNLQNASNRLDEVFDADYLKNNPAFGPDVPGQPWRQTANDAAEAAGGYPATGWRGGAGSYRDGVGAQEPEGAEEEQE